MRRIILSPQRCIRWAAALWFIALLVISVRVLAQPNSHSVYPIFVQAGRDWLAGADLYGKSTTTVDQFRYSPIVAAAFAPLSILSDRVGNLLWRWLNAGVLLAALAWWAWATLPADDCVDEDSGPLRSRLASWVFILVLPLALGSLNNGQSNALVLGLILAALAGSIERRWGLVSICLAFACLFKVYPIAVGLLLAVVYPRRLTLRLVLALAAGAALPFVLQHPEYVAEQYRAWFRHLGGDDRQTWPVELTYRDLRLLFRVWWIPLNARSYQIVQCCVAAGIAGICFIGQRSLRQRRGAQNAATAAESIEKMLLLWLFAFASCWMTVFGAATESSTYILLAPALATVLVQVWHEGRPRWERLLLAVCYALLAGAQLANWFPFGRRFHTYGPQPTGTLVFFIYLVARTCITRTGAMPQRQNDQTPKAVSSRAA